MKNLPNRGSAERKAKATRHPPVVINRRRRKTGFGFKRMNRRMAAWRPYPPYPSCGFFIIRGVAIRIMKVSVKNITNVATKHGFVGAGFKPAQGASVTNRANFPPQGRFEARPYAVMLGSGGGGGGWS